MTIGHEEIVMKHSTYLSLGLLIAVVGWMLSGAFANMTKQAPQEKLSMTLPKMKVKVLDLEAQDIFRELVVQGELEPLRQVVLRAQTASRVIELLVDKGQRVETGMLLIQLAEEDRAAELRRSQAEVKHQKLELAGAIKLKKKGLQAENRVKAAKAALAAAEVDLTRARLELDYTRIKAPFAGIIEARYVELGSHLDRSDSVVLLVDDSVLKAVGRVSQQSAHKLRLGQQIMVRLLDGRKARGQLTYVSRVGDSNTHSFRVEAEILNPEGSLNAGTSAELRIAINTEAAHFLSPAALTLDDSGVVGVKSVDNDSKVRFFPINLVRTEADGVWVSGLPERVKVITQGQGFVNAGESVIPVPAS